MKQSPNPHPTFGPALPSAGIRDRPLAPRGWRGSTVQKGVGTSTRASQRAARPEGGVTGCPGVPLAMVADCTEAMGGGLAYPLYAARSHGIFRARDSWKKVHMSRNQGVHQSLVRRQQAACHVAESPPGPTHHDRMAVTGPTPAPAGGERASTAGTSWLTTVPFFLPITTHLDPARALHTQPSRLRGLPGRHPGNYLLAAAPSAH